MQTGQFILLCISATILTVSASSRTQSVSKVNWDIVGKYPINKKCEYNARGNCIGACPLTGGACVELLNYDTKVCGCQYCKFNATSNSCQGQCSNLVISKCVSIVDSPSNDRDCVCSSCSSSTGPVDNINDYGVPETTIEDSCNDQTCNNNECLPVYVRTELVPRSPLECICLNKRK
jgi:hypothetical protein